MGVGIRHLTYSLTIPLFYKGLCETRTFPCVYVCVNFQFLRFDCYLEDSMLCTIYYTHSLTRSLVLHHTSTHSLVLVSLSRGHFFPLLLSFLRAVWLFPSGQGPLVSSPPLPLEALMYKQPRNTSPGHHISLLPLLPSIFSHHHVYVWMMTSLRLFRSPSSSLSNCVYCVSNNTRSATSQRYRDSLLTGEKPQKTS